MEEFGRFFIERNYVLLKNSLFNYINRKNSIRIIFDKYDLKNKQMIVDMGCGLSPVTPIPKKTLFIDISKEALGYLKKQGYQTKYGDVTKIPLKSNSVDIMFSSEVLEHVDNYKKALKEMSRVLKKNGKLILTVPCYNRYWDFDDEFVNHKRRFEPEIFKKELESMFKIIEEKPIGSIIERIFTKMAVRLFKNRADKKNFSYGRVIISRVVNYILFLIVKVSLLFTSKKSTSIMLYYCEK